MQENLTVSLWCRKGSKNKSIGILLLLLFCIHPLAAEPCGDVNSSGIIDIVDALMTAQYYVGLDPRPYDVSAADVSGDGYINIVDALQTAQYYIGIITTFEGCMSPPPPTGTPPPVTIEMQAEDGTWNNADIEADYDGYTGSGYVNTVNASGTWIEWSLNIANDTPAVCDFRYACASDNRSMDFSVNGTSVASLSFPASGAWTTWAIEKAPVVSLNTGFNTLRLTATSGGGAPNMDKMDITMNSFTVIPATPRPTYPPTSPPHPGWTYPPNAKPRVIVTTDGGADDRSSMVRFLVYNIDYDVEGIVQVNSMDQPNGHSDDRWIEKELDLYEQVLPNLKQHNLEYRSVELLSNVITVGNENNFDLLVDPPDMETQNTGGERLIINTLLLNDNRPVHVACWGGANTIASALWRLKYTGEYTRAQYEEAVSKIRIYCTGYQDGGGSWIEENVKEVMIYEAHGWENVWDAGSLSGPSPDEVKEYMTGEWLDENVKNGHGALGAYTPQDYVSESGTPSFLHLVDNGLEAYTDYTLGGWGGRAAFNNPFNWRHLTDLGLSDDGDSNKMFWRWIIAAQNDFAARMDWCVTPLYGNANHRPHVDVYSDTGVVASAGETVTLSADSYDPDGDDLTYSWWQYHDADIVEARVSINNNTSVNASFTVPNEPGREIHIILEVKDNGNPPLTSYKRIIISIR